MSIPSPSSGSLEIGPITLRMYGLMIALGVIAGVWLIGKRFVAKGISEEHASGIAIWSVPAGILGARLYHVITDWKRFQGNWDEAFQIWKGGLGILGGVILGILAASLYCRKHELDIRKVLDAVAPAIPLAQSIGRWGNYFNQELYGRPTNLPWALEIKEQKRPSEYLTEDTYHPTFLYESLWNLVVVYALIKISKTGKVANGLLLGVYFALYSVGRLWIEALRIDEASNLAGLRVNIWVFSAVLLTSISFVVSKTKQHAEPDPTQQAHETD